MKKKICLYVLLALTGCFLMMGCHRGSKSGSDSTGKQSEQDQTFLPEQGQIGNLNVFRAFSVDNETFTNDIFDDNQVTIIVFWAPWSDASVYELQNFNDFVKKLPDRIGFITVAMDDEVKSINNTLKKVGMSEYTTLVTGDGDFKLMYDAIENVPTTIVVDHEGTVIGGPVIGIQDDFEKKYLSEINRSLKSIKKKTIKLETEVSEQKKTDKEETEQEESDQEGFDQEESDQNNSDEE